jgi:predicted anti-sigma-YlaC factor YlaD
MMTCKEASQLVSESLDHKLPLHKLISLKMHLMMCSMCRRFAGQLKSIRQIMPALAKMEADLDRPSEIRLSPEAKARIVGALTST